MHVVRESLTLTLPFDSIQLAWRRRPKPLSAILELGFGLDR